MMHRKWTDDMPWPGREQAQHEHNAAVQAITGLEKQVQEWRDANNIAHDQIAALEQWKQETLDENNRLDRELDERDTTNELYAMRGQEIDTLKARIAELEASLKAESEWVSTYKQDRDDALAELAALRPWLREPTGWELDVTAGEIMQACTTNLNGYEVALELCRSRIRPTFECAECAKTKERKRPSRAELMEIIHGLGFSMIQSNMVVAITDAFLAALEGE